MTTIDEAKRRFMEWLQVEGTIIGGNSRQRYAHEAARIFSGESSEPEPEIVYGDGKEYFLRRGLWAEFQPNGVLLGCIGWEGERYVHRQWTLLRIGDIPTCPAPPPPVLPLGPKPRRFIARKPGKAHWGVDGFEETSWAAEYAKLGYEIEYIDAEEKPCTR